jgi:hypothetical protein
MLPSMGDMLKLTWWAVIGLFRSMVSLKVETFNLHGNKFTGNTCTGRYSAAS